MYSSVVTVISSFPQQNRWSTLGREGGVVIGGYKGGALILACILTNHELL